MEESSIVKGKRTKRQRNHLSPPKVSFVLSPTTFAEISESPTAEEEYVANCLMFLAGGGHNSKPNEIKEAATVVNITSLRFTEPATTTTTTGNARNNAHQCRDCYRCFPSHQALGGHRASHNKKPKLSIPLTSEVMNVNSIESTINPFSSPATNKVTIYRCAICSKEFNSGQALGGHMRKHRSSNTPEPPKEENPKRFYLDLNFPPPWDDFEDNDAREMGFN